jgi:hypothetical protein
MTMRISFAALLAGALAGAPAFAQERPSEEQLFGAPGTAEKPPPAAEGAQETAPPKATEVPLALGGVAYLRATTTWRKGTSAEESQLLSPNLVDLYLDARPNDRVRGFVLGRLFYDPTQSTSPFATQGAGDASGGGVTPFGSLTSQGGTRSVLDQLWLNFDVGRTVFVTAGKQHVKWGVGRFWNPTDYLHPVKRDPLAVYDTRAGVTMVKAHLPWEARGWNLYGVALLEDAAGQGPIRTVGRVGGGSRAEIVLGNVEVGADALVQRGNRPRFGVDVSAGVWDLDLYGEAALRSGADVERVVSTSSDTSLPVNSRFAFKPSTGFTPQVTLGGTWSWKYSDEDSLTLGAEYFFNDAGYSDPHVYAGLLAAQIFPQLVGVQGGAYFNPFYLGRHYAGVFLNVPKPGRWNDADFTVSVLGNLSDRSSIARFDASVLVNTYLRVETYVAAHAGPEGGEFRLAFSPQQVALPPQNGQTVPSTIAIPGLGAPILDLGVALRVSL